MRGRLAMVLKKGTAALYYLGSFPRKIEVKTRQGMAWEPPWLSPAKRDLVAPCLDLEDETG
jgi:hypothetical protein